MIHYDLPELKWLQDPPPAKGRRYLNQQEPDTFGLWRSDTKDLQLTGFSILMIKIPAQLMKRVIMCSSSLVLEVPKAHPNIDLAPDTTWLICMVQVWSFDT